MPAHLVTAAYVLALLLGTLWPLPSTGAESFSACLLCGRYGVADALLNLLLFLPLGMLAARCPRRRAALASLVLLSLGIELTQTLVPGRDPSAGDLLFNTCGALAGAALVLLWRRALALSAHSRPVAALLSTGAAMLVVWLSGWTLQPSIPAGPFWVEWQTTREDLAAYPGTIAAAGTGRVLVPPGPALRMPALRAELERGLYATAFVVPGAPSEALAPVFALYDTTDAMVVLLGAEGRDLVFRIQRRAHALRLHSPGVRLPDALPGATADTLLLAVRRDPSGHGLCMRAGTVQRCGIGFSAGSGWRLVHAGFGTPALDRLLGVLWLALLALPAGYLARPRTAVALLAVLLWYAFIRVPVDTVLLPISRLDAAGLVAGWGAGVLFGRFTGAARGAAAAPPSAR